MMGDHLQYILYLTLTADSNTVTKVANYHFNSTLCNRPTENCLVLMHVILKKLGGKSAAQLEWNSTVSQCACVQRFATVTLLMLVESFRRGCLPKEENECDAGILLTRDSTGSKGIRD